MNIGVLGGTFDPPHIGHLILAESARIELSLQTIFFLPNYVSPFKEEMHSLEADVRAELVSLAITGNKNFCVEFSEVKKHEVSYTVDTLRSLKVKYPDEHLFLLMGADAFNEFHLWKEPDEIVKLSTLAIALRPGNKIDLTSHPFGEFATLFSIPQIDVSSTDIRQRIREGKSIQYLVPWTVQTFIESKRLYRDS